MDRVALNQFIQYSFNDTIKCHVEELALLLAIRYDRSLVNVVHVQ